MTKPALVAVKIEADYWPATDEVFINDAPVAEGERLPRGMEVQMVKKRAFTLSNSGVVKLVIPSE